MKQFFKKLYGGVSDVILVFDHQGTLCYTNKDLSAERINQIKSNTNSSLISNIDFNDTSYQIITATSESAEQNWKLEEKKYKHIFKSFQDLYIRIDLDGKIQMVSPSITDMLGYDEQSVIGEDITNYYLYTVQVKAFFKTLIRNHKLKNVELDLIAKNGNIIHYNCNLRLLHNDHGNPEAIDIVCRDITDIKTANEDLMKAKEALEASISVKEQFLANMSHEIRTPMNGIVGLIGLLLESPLTNQQEKYLHTIESSSNQLLKLLNDILDLSKAKSGVLKVQPINTDINEVLSEVQNLFAAEIAKKGIKFNLSSDEYIPKIIRIDKLKVSQVIFNLVSNALKFTNEGGSIEVSMHIANHNILKINVIDTGIGIKKEYHKLLFANFSQVQNKYSKSHEGAGLGLAISKELVGVMGGEIGFKSEYGKGSNFWFEIPYASPKKSAASGCQNVVPSITSDTNSRVLIVDDNPTNRMVAAEILRKKGFEIDQTDNGMEALYNTRDIDYDFVLMDIQMPEMDGIATMHAIKEHNKKVPVVAMTAYGAEDHQHYHKMGFDGYIRKPITPRSFESIIAGKQVDNYTKQHSRIDPSIINDLINHISEEHYWSTFKIFKNQLDKLQTKVMLAETARDYTVLEAHIHSIKGDASTLGLSQIASLSRDIEKNLIDQEYSILGERLKHLYLAIREFPSVKDEIINQLRK